MCTCVYVYVYICVCVCVCVCTFCLTKLKCLNFLWAPYWKFNPTAGVIIPVTYNFPVIVCSVSILSVNNSYLWHLSIKNWSHYRPLVAQRVGRGIALLFHDRRTRRRWVVSITPRPHFTPGKGKVPILQKAGWAPGPVWTEGKFRPHRDSIPDRPARSQSLYRLSYRAHNYPLSEDKMCLPNLKNKLVSLTSSCLSCMAKGRRRCMFLIVFISLIFAQHVSNINMSIFRSLRLWWWITTSVILFCKDICFCN